MKLIKKVTCATLAALAVALLFQTPTTRAGDNGQRGDDNERRGRDHRGANVTFTKWIVAFPNMPGLIANMAGVVGGDVGEGLFTGEILLRVPGTVNNPVTRIVALYHFTGPKHSFTALVHVESTAVNAVILGVVTDGWLKGHALAGEYTVITCDHVGPSPSCFQGTLEIAKDSKD